MNICNKYKEIQQIQVNSKLSHMVTFATLKNLNTDKMAIQYLQSHEIEDGHQRLSGRSIILIIFIYLRH